MRYFMTLAYDGSAYHGWQIQPHSVSVQEQIQNALSTLLQKTVEIVGAGRTDTGVHASKMVAHFDLDEADSIDCGQMVYRLNKILPRDIAIQRIEPVGDEMHARFSAVSRTYHYYVHTSKNPFLRHYSWQVYGNPDFELMNRAAETIKEYKDFTSFSKVNTDTKTNDCTISEAHWDKVGDGQWRFTITANRFLRNMVRAIVGTLMEVGRGKMSIEQLRNVIEAKDRCRAGDSVPGNALFLVDVKYHISEK